jgi:hypothetical protein
VNCGDFGEITTVGAHETVRGSVQRRSGLRERGAPLPQLTSHGDECTKTEGGEYNNGHR